MVLQGTIQETYNDILDTQEMYKGRDDKFVCLMDLALMAMKTEKRRKTCRSGRI